jgi:hypothetical protein
LCVQSAAAARTGTPLHRDGSTPPAQARRPAATPVGLPAMSPSAALNAVFMVVLRWGFWQPGWLGCPEPCVFVGWCTRLAVVAGAFSPRQRHAHLVLLRCVRDLVWHSAVLCPAGYRPLLPPPQNGWGGGVADVAAVWHPTTPSRSRTSLPVCSKSTSCKYPLTSRALWQPATPKSGCTTLRRAAMSR